MTETSFVPPTLEAIDALLRFLPVFEQKGFVASKPCTFEMKGKNMVLFDEEQTPDVRDFIHAAYEGGFVFPYPWVEWQDQAERYVLNPQTMAEASLKDVCKLLTCHMRKERFCSGHLSSMFACGHIVEVLRRLQTLRFELASQMQAR